MTYLILLIPIAILGFLLWRSDRRFDNASERWAEERSGLLRRIQAPERAQFEDFEPSNLKQYASYGDDEDTFNALAEVNGGD